MGVGVWGGGGGKGARVNSVNQVVNLSEIYVSLSFDVVAVDRYFFF